MIQLPSSNAAYLNNPAPNYPAASKRMGETGKVMVRAYIDENGAVQDIQLKTSSGYDRLDQAALDTVRRWRFKPGTSNGVARPMWVNVPINFVLN